MDDSPVRKQENTKLICRYLITNFIKQYQDLDLDLMVKEMLSICADIIVEMNPGKEKLYVDVFGYCLHKSKQEFEQEKSNEEKTDDADNCINRAEALVQFMKEMNEFRRKVS